MGPLISTGLQQCILGVIRPDARIILSISGGGSLDGDMGYSGT